MTTPTSHVQLAKLTKAVTTSTPTHPACVGWTMFPEQGAESPLSEIENSESPAQSITNEPSKQESESVPRKLKSIIAIGSRVKLGSQDSSEKQVTFQDTNVTEASSIKKRVKFAEDTVFEQETKIKRVYRKPKRMLTPGPQRPRFCCNPRFQALINRFESQGLTLARTPVSNRELETVTTPAGEAQNLPARAINFKEDSPQVESQNHSGSNELFNTCVESPVAPSNALTALTANIAGSLQNCLSALKASEEETEIQFKFVITRKKVSVKRIVEDGDGIDEKSSEVERGGSNKENIWSTVAKAVKNVFWSETNLATPHCSFLSTSSQSSAKRKCEEVSDVESPLNHKRHKYEGRIRGRPPLRRGRTWVASLRSSQSAEQQTLLSKTSSLNDDVMNQSF